MIVPGTSKLSFIIQLNSDNDVNRTIVNNLGRAIVSKLEVKLEGRSIFTLDDSDVFLCYQDLWKITNERENAVDQGIQSADVRKIRIDSGDKGTATKDVTIGTAYSMILKSLSPTCLSSKVNSMIDYRTSLRLTIMEK